MEEYWSDGMDDTTMLACIALFEDNLRSAQSWTRHPQDCGTCRLMQERIDEMRAKMGSGGIINVVGWAPKLSPVNNMLSVDPPAVLTAESHIPMG